jgi:lipopolysaccharide biosynthesis glycosyltransferase
LPAEEIASGKNDVVSGENIGENVIPVVMTSDNGYGAYMHIAMQSMLKSANGNTFYDFYLLVSPDFKEIYSKAILELSKSHKCRVNFINMGERLKNVRPGFFPPASYYRLAAAELLPNLDKCLYLDIDIIVRHDLSELYNSDISGYYIAGIKDTMQLHNCQKITKVMKACDQYVNSGVLLMNLKLIREDGLGKKFMEEAYRKDVKYMFPDQDILNKTCYDGIKFLHLKFNLFPCIYAVAGKADSERAEFEAFFSKKQFDEACNDPVIVHVADCKPWRGISTKFATEWWEYAKKSPFYETALRGYATRKVCSNFPGKYSKVEYYRCKILSKITFGDKKMHYEKKCKRMEKAKKSDW